MNEKPAAIDATAAQARTMLWILLIVYIFNFLDRQIVNILAEPIKADLKLSDTQLGLLAGPAFAVFYALLGIPIARYADKEGANRVRLVALALAIWSAMTAVCGLAQNFVQLLLARIGVGVGEAGRSEEHTSELQSLMRISYDVFCLKKQTNNTEKMYQTTKGI